MLQSLDVSTLTQLTSLDVHGCDLQSFDVTHNPELVTLIASDNSIPALDVTNNPHLVTLECSHNALSRIDVSKNPGLQRLDLSYNAMTMTNFTANTALTWLDVTGNTALTTLNVTNNPQLTYLGASDLSLASLDIDVNTAIDTLYLDADECYLVVSDFRTIDNVNTFGKVCVFNDDNGASYYIRWGGDKACGVTSAEEECIKLGMALPTLEEAENIAQRMPSIMRVIHIDFGVYIRRFYTADRLWQIELSNDFNDYKIVEKDGYLHFYFATFVKH